MAKHRNWPFIGGIIVVGIALVAGITGLVTFRPQPPGSESTPSFTVQGGRPAPTSLPPAPNFPITLYQGEELHELRSSAQTTI